MATLRARRYDDGYAGPVAGGGLLALANIIAVIASVVAGIIVLGIVLVLLKANPSNGIVNAIHDAAQWLAGPFDGLFSFDNSKTEIAVNWGIAAVVYYVVGHFIARMLAR